MVERIVSFRNLLLTARAVKRRGTWVRVHLAGRISKPYWIEFATTTVAKTAAGSLMRHLVEKDGREQITGDGHYNQIIVDWIDQLDALGYIRNKERRDEKTENGETAGVE